MKNCHQHRPNTWPNRVFNDFISHRTRSSYLFTQKCLIAGHKTLLQMDDLIMTNLSTISTNQQSVVFIEKTSVVSVLTYPYN